MNQIIINEEMIQGQAEAVLGRLLRPEEMSDVLSLLGEDYDLFIQDMLHEALKRPGVINEEDTEQGSYI